MGVQNPNSTDYVHPDEPNLLNLHKAMQYNGNGEPEIRTATSINGNIIIEGNVNIPGTITVNSTPEDPVHVHVTEVGNSGILNVPYMPINGNVTFTNTTIEVTQGTDPWHISGNVVVSGNVNVDTLPAITGNVEANVSGNVVVSGNVNVDTLPAITGDITGNVIVSGNVNIDSLPEVEIKNDIDNPIPISKDSNVNSATNRIYVSQETDVVLADSNYEMNIARGLVDGQYVVTRSALNPSVSQNIETSIWVEGGIYPFGTWTTAQRLFVVSDDTADTGQTIFIEGLDNNFVRQTATVTTNGTTGVLTTESFRRIFTATITSASNNSANTGEIRFKLGSNSGTVVAHISAGFGITKLSQYTVPAGYTGYILYGDATTFRGGSGNIGSQVRMMIRPYGGSFILAFVAEVVNGYYRNDFTVPLQILEKTDIDVRIVADANNTVASCNYQLILIPNA